MHRITLFAKGNVDVRDTLVAQRIDGRVTWNGINEMLRAKGIAATVRVRHETWARSDQLLQAQGHAPGALQGRELPLGAHPFSSQFSRAIFDVPADAYVLSVQADIFTTLLRHRRDGFLFHAQGWQGWPEADRAWLRDTFEPTRLLDASESMDNFERVIARLRERTQAPIVVYNVSPLTPGESVHCYAGLHETYSTRAKRFNLELIGLSQRTGISIIDVDRIVAKLGADRCKSDSVHLNALGCEAVAAEVLRVLADLGVMDKTGNTP